MSKIKQNLFKLTCTDVRIVLTVYAGLHLSCKMSKQRVPSGNTEIKTLRIERQEGQPSHAIRMVNGSGKTDGRGGRGVVVAECQGHIKNASFPSSVGRAEHTRRPIEHVIFASWASAGPLQKLFRKKRTRGGENRKEEEFREVLNR